MFELLQAAVSPPNLPPTALLVFVLLYWLTVMIGLLDASSLDLDIEAETDANILSTDWFDGGLAFFNLGRIPLMVFLSFVAVPMWAGSILTNYYTGNTSFLLGLVFLLPLFTGSLFLAKFLTLPFVKLFAVLEKDHGAGAVVIGKVCTILLPVTAERLGQATVHIDGSPLMLNVKAASATAELRKGDTALVIDFDAQRRVYLIEPYEA